MAERQDQQQPPPGGPPPGGKKSRVDQLADQQKMAIDTVAEFVSQAATLTLKGEIKPSELIVAYSKMLKDLGKNVAAITRIALSD